MTETNREGENEQQDPTNQIYVGVDKEGFFVTKIHMKNNPLMIIGFLDDAKAKFRGMLIEATKKAQQKDREIIKPSRSNFLNKWRR